MTRVDSFPVAFVVGLVVLAGAAVALSGGGPGASSTSGFLQSSAEATGQQSTQQVGAGGSSGFLQSKSEATGQQAAEQVSNRLQVVSTAGTNLSDDGVGVALITVKKAPGAADIDLSKTTVRWVGPSGTYRLSARSAGGDRTFGVRPVVDSDDSVPVLNEPDDRARLVVDLGTNETGVDGPGALPAKLDPGAQATVTLTTQTGGESTVRLVVPETLQGDVVEL